MNNKSIIGLTIAAVALGGAAYFLNGNSKPSTPQLNGRQILPGLSVADVARIEIGGKLTLAAGEDGWKVESLHGYPADREKIAENLLKLAELKVGQVARGRKLGTETAVVLKDATGKTLADVKLGDAHNGKARGQMAMYGGGGYPDGRYVAYEGQTVLVMDTLDAFGDDAKKWCNTRIASVSSADVKGVTYKGPEGECVFEKGTNGVWTLNGLGPKEELDTSKTYSLDSALSYLDFTGVVDPKLTEAELGFATGCVYTAVCKDGSNTVTHVAHVGNVAKSGDRYFKLDGNPWIYTISSYSAGNMMKKRADFVKAKAEPAKQEESKAAEPAK